MPMLRLLAHKHPRLVAGIWFALASLILSMIVAYILVEVLDRNMNDLMKLPLPLFLLVIPPLSAAITGATIGARIFDPLRTESSIKALDRGVWVAFFSSLMLAICIVIEALFRNGIGGVNKGVVDAGHVLIFIIVPAILIGGAAGWLLYRLAVPNAGRKNNRVDAGLRR